MAEYVKNIVIFDSDEETQELISIAKQNYMDLNIYTFD